MMELSLTIVTTTHWTVCVPEVHWCLIPLRKDIMSVCMRFQRCFLQLTCCRQLE